MNEADRLKKLDGKVIIVTGANTGIGYETALDLAGRNATVILACRDETKGKEAANKIIEETKNDKVFFEKLDLSSLKSIKEFADNFKSKYNNRLDILINNAGLSNTPFKLTADGFETQIAIMHLGHFYLTNLLIDCLKASAPSRIINVSSMAHYGASINWEDLNLEKNYNSMTAYRQSKLANVLFTIELSNRYKDDGITAVSLHPGFVKTDITRSREDATTAVKVFMTLLKPLSAIFAKDAKKGAETTIFCAVNDDVPKNNGAYYSDCQVKAPSAEAQNPESPKRLWDLSWSLINPKISQFN